jgi:hypothetical protein
VRLPLLPAQPGSADTALRCLGALEVAGAARG